MSKIIENDRNLLKDALVEYNAIKEEAIKVAKDRLAKTMPDVIENFLKEELEKSMYEMDESIIDGEGGSMINQKESMIDTMKEPDQPVAEGEDHIDDMEMKEEVSDYDDDLTAQAIEEALKELEGMEEISEDDDIELELEEDELEEHNVSFNVDFDEDKLKIKDIKSDDNEFDDVEFELEMDDDSDMSDEMDGTLDISGEMESELDMSDDEEVEDDDVVEDEIDFDSLEEEEVEESLAHTNTHQNAKGAGSHNNTNYDKARKLRPAMRESKLKGDLDKVIKENEELREINLEFKEALKKYKDQLYEMAVFNANLSHVNNLFVEHTTTADEKKNILSRFKSVATIDESKNVYKEFAQKLNESTSKKKTFEEMVVETPKGDSGSGKLHESISNQSENDGIKAIKYMMNYIENKRK
jgi:hypothetical protein